MLDALKLERSKILAWLTCVEEDYNRANPYHNALHAADVCANVDYFIRQPNLNKLLSPLDILYGAHQRDHLTMKGHPGVKQHLLGGDKTRARHHLQRRVRLGEPPRRGRVQTAQELELD